MCSVLSHSVPGGSLPMLNFNAWAWLAEVALENAAFS